jgi:hypothetical protein
MVFHKYRGAFITSPINRNTRIKNLKYKVSMPGEEINIVLEIKLQNI